MTTIWVLTAVFASQPLWGPIEVNNDALVYKTAEGCLHHVDAVRKQLKEYKYVKVECIERELK